MVAKFRLLRFIRRLTAVFTLIYALVVALIIFTPQLPLPEPLRAFLSENFVNYRAWWLVGIPATTVVWAIAWLLLYLGRQAWHNWRIEKRGTIRVIALRQDLKTSIKDAVQFWNQVPQLTPKHQHVSYSLAGSVDGVYFSTCANDGVSRALITQAMADWPGTQSRPVTGENDPIYVAPDKPAYHIILRSKNPKKPILAAVDDPLAAPLVEIARLPKGVRGGILVLVRPDPYTRRKLGAAAAVASMETGQSLQEKREIKASDQRAQRIFLECRLIVWAAASTPKMARSVARSLANSVMAQYQASNPLKKHKEKSGRPRRAFPLFAGCPWTDGEIATIAHLKGKGGRALAPQLETAPANPLPPSPACCVPHDARTCQLLLGSAA